MVNSSRRPRDVVHHLLLFPLPLLATSLSPPLIDRIPCTYSNSVESGQIVEIAMTIVGDRSVFLLPLEVSSLDCAYGPLLCVGYGRHDDYNRYNDYGRRDRY